MSELMVNFLIDDQNAGKYIDKEEQGFRGGLVERDYGQHPVGCYASEKPFDTSIDLIPRENGQSESLSRRQKSQACTTSMRRATTASQSQALTRTAKAFVGYIRRQAAFRH